MWHRPEPCRRLGPTDELLGRYRDYQRSERGLAASTVNGYVNFVRPFVRRREAADGTLRLEDLTAQDITAFVVAEVPGRPTGSAKLTVTALRSLLGFLHLEGVVACPLTSAVPSVAGTRLAGLPKALEGEEVQRLLRSCDRLLYCNVQSTFQRLVQHAGLKARSAQCRPRLHDLRHSFAVRTVIDAYRADANVAVRLPLLSTYLGHVHPAHTYWYLCAAPELLALAGQRLERSLEEQT